MKKRLISALLVLALLCVLAACGAKNAEPENAGIPSAASQLIDAAEQAAEPDEPPADHTVNVIYLPAQPAQDAGAQPDAEGSFRFTRSNFPRLDGSTSLVPLGEAVASVLLGERREEVEDLVNFSRTTQSFTNLMSGYRDLLLVSEPHASVFTQMEEAGVSVEMEQIATEALVFLVNAQNPVDSLSAQQLRDIYSGKITNWKEVGGADAEIIPFQRNETAGSQVLMEKLVMQGEPMMEPVSAYVALGMGELMDGVKSYDNSANALGYSVYYYAHDMQMAGGLKMLKIDGVAPEKQTIRSGDYPFCNGYFCAIRASEAVNSPARILFNWLQTEPGQRLLDSEGYVPVN